MRKKEVSIFVSYSHESSKSALDFVDRLEDKLNPSKNFVFNLWLDRQLEVGSNWENSILEKAKCADFGLILVSTSLLRSKFVIEKELPLFMGGNIHKLIPVLLSDVDFTRNDLMGIDPYQIFRLRHERFNAPRSFAKCKKNRADDFAQHVYEIFYDKSIRIFKK
jgi:hypothetical protein